MLDALLDAIQHLVEDKGVVCQELTPQDTPQAVHIKLPLLALAEQLRTMGVNSGNANETQQEHCSQVSPGHAAA